MFRELDLSQLYRGEGGDMMTQCRGKYRVENDNLVKLKVGYEDMGGNRKYTYVIV